MLVVWGWMTGFVDLLQEEALNSISGLLLLVGFYGFGFVFRWSFILTLLPFRYFHARLQRPPKWLYAYALERLAPVTFGCHLSMLDRSVATRGFSGIGLP